MYVCMYTYIYIYIYVFYFLFFDFLFFVQTSIRNVVRDHDVDAPLRVGSHKNNDNYAIKNNMGGNRQPC